MSTRTHPTTYSGQLDATRSARHRRRLIAVAATVTALLAAGCGNDRSDGDDGTATPLTAEQTEQVLLTVENLGEGYEADEDSDDSGTPPFGCLTALDDFDEDADAVEADASFAFQPDTTLGVPEVANEALSFDTDADAETFMTGFTDTFADCAVVDERSGNGIDVQLDITLDDDQAAGVDVDDQANLRATGTFTHADTALKFTIVMTLVRVDNNVVAILTNDLAGTDEVDPLVAEYTRLAVERLNAVTAGDEPPSDTATVTPTPRTGPPVSA